ncbi:Uncharacterised protein [Klebsiella pneumoniae]|nr:Uncharacterised protein [Klebsiella pneumoniae]
MSSLICFSTDEFAIVATDTLGVDAEGNPFILTNKATYLPTIKTIICGTGTVSVQREPSGHNLKHTTKWCPPNK